MKCWDADRIILEKEDTESKKYSPYFSVKSHEIPIFSLRQFVSVHKWRQVRPSSTRGALSPGRPTPAGVNYPEHQGFDPHIDDSLLTHADCTQREHLNMKKLDSDNLSSPNAGRW